MSNAAREAREIRGAMSEANDTLMTKLALVEVLLDDTSEALRKAMDHMTGLERENEKLRRALADFCRASNWGNK